jgi:hypothetical protein
VTTQTMPAPPHQNVSLRPLPWRRMAWVTWRQHRLALAGVVAVFGATAVYLLITGLPMHNAYATVAACHPASSSACRQVAQNFLNNHVHGVLVTAGLIQAINHRRRRRRQQPAESHHLRSTRRCAPRVDARRVRDRRPRRQPDPPRRPHDIRHARGVGCARLSNRRVSAPALPGASGHPQRQTVQPARW